MGNSSWEGLRDVQSNQNYFWEKPLDRPCLQISSSNHRIIPRKSLPICCEEAGRSLWSLTYTMPNFTSFYPSTRGNCQFQNSAGALQAWQAGEKWLWASCSSEVPFFFHRHWNLGWIWPGKGWNKEWCNEMTANQNHSPAHTFLHSGLFCQNCLEVQLRMESLGQCRI